MRVSPFRFAALAAGVAFIVSCDGAPTTTRIGSGLSGGPSGTAPVTTPAPGTPDPEPPIAIIDQPVANPVQLVNVGDSIFLQVRLHDDRALKRMTVAGYRETGDANLGNFQRIERYRLIEVPSAQGTAFRPGLTDTTIRRFLQPAQPLDTSLGRVVIEVVVEDSAGNVGSFQRNVEIVAGPKITIIQPNDSVPVGRTMMVVVEGTDGEGVDRDSIHVQGDVNWPTPFAQQSFVIDHNGENAISDTLRIPVPSDAPLRSRITINATAYDINQNPGRATPVTVFTRASGTRAPLVRQTVPARMERTDSFDVVATGDGIAAIGRILIDPNTGAEIANDTVFFNPAEITGNQPARLPLLDSLGLQGRRVDIISFAIDNNTPAKIGWSVAASATVPVELRSLAFKDTTLVTFGRTFAPPRSGVMGDLQVDANRGNVFLSNTFNNLLEVWDNTAKVWSTTGIPVGSQPWGMFQSIVPETLLVANSGGTTISRVFIGTNDKTQMREALNRRIRTRDLNIFVVQFIRDPNTGKIRLIGQPSISYSDRPQYVVESMTGRIFFSTKPTDAAQPGTVRWLDPTQPFPDPQQITSYAVSNQTDDFTYFIFHVDSVAIGATPPNTTISDTLYIWDHRYGTLGVGADLIFQSDSFPVSAFNKMRTAGSDIQMILNMVPTSLDLTDTTFVAASGDRRWIAFGEGNTDGGPLGKGRIMMVNDPTPWAGPGICPNAFLCSPGFFSPFITVRDIVHNAAERVFGLAIDSTGLQVTSHGLQTYMAAVDLPFHLRLDGVYDSFDNGAGVAYHPRAKSTLSQADHRVSFSATASGVIEVIDVAHYNNRGQFITKGNLYGPLRVSGPLPGDNVGLACPGDVNCVVLKIFGLTATGMVVIDVRASDIKPGF